MLSSGSSAVIETLKTVLQQHAFPGCLPLNVANLMIQDSLVLVTLLEKSMAGSPLAAPVGQILTDNPVAKAYVSPSASPMQEILGDEALKTQCLAGTFTELGLNAAAVESLSCHESWKQGYAVKGHQGTQCAPMLARPTRCCCTLHKSAEMLSWETGITHVGANEAGVPLQPITHKLTSTPC